MIIKYLPYIICAILMIFSIKDSVQGSLEERSAKYSLNRLVYNISIFITFFIMLNNLEKIYLEVLKLINNYSSMSVVNNNLIKASVLALSFLVFQTIIYWIIQFLSSPFIQIYEKILGKRNFAIITISSFLGFLKGLVVIFIMFMSIVTFNSLFAKEAKINLFNEITGFTKLEDMMTINKPVLSYNNEELKYANKDRNIIIYYNGVTLEDGIKSNIEINKKASDIVKTAKSDRERAKRIYSWVGSNINYDFDKAERALGKEGINNSGAIEAWNTRQGICFDYACLYVAMGKAVGLKTRIITGEAFDGTSYGPHAWNQAYLEDEGIWINLDPTFYLSGDYFDNKDFNNDHLNAEIAGEW